MNEQLSLFDDYQDNGTQLKPRPKNEPVKKAKNTQAVSSTFGWFFQVIAAIVLSLEYRTELEKVKVEGKTEDIELYLRDGKKPIYVQAKSTSKKPEDAPKKDVKGHCRNAMNTLVNTSNIVEGKYSRLIYISNFLNPLNLDKRIADARWNPKATELLEMSFDNLPKQGQDFLRECEDSAKKALREKKYLSTDNYFDWEKLIIATLPMARESILEEKQSFRKTSRLLLATIEEILEKATGSTSFKTNIFDTLVAQYFENSTKTSATITYKEIMWTFISQIILHAKDDYIESSVDIALQEDVRIYSNNFINDLSLNIDVINKVIYLWEKYKRDHKDKVSNEKLYYDYLEENWTEFKESFSLENEKIQKCCIQDLINKILIKSMTIKELREEFEK